MDPPLIYQYIHFRYYLYRQRHKLNPNGYTAVEVATHDTSCRGYLFSLMCRWPCYPLHVLLSFVVRGKETGEHDEHVDEHAINDKDPDLRPVAMLYRGQFS